MSRFPRMLVAVLLGAASPVAVPAAGLAEPSAAAAADATPQTALHRWSTDAEWRSGAVAGLAVGKGRMRLDAGPHRRAVLRDPYGSTGLREYDKATWTSPWVTTGFAAQSLVASWNVATPNHTFVRVLVKTRTASRRGSWDSVAYWAHKTSRMHRHSGTTQTDDVARLATDTVIANGTQRITAWKVRVVLFRPRGWSRSPNVHSIGAVAASYLDRSRGTSRTTMTEPVALPVPAYSQMVHRTHHEQWNGGGEAWCSPTSTAMVLDYWGHGPTDRQLAWTGEADGEVDHAARHTYDHAFGGTGNWPFNTAYAGQQGLDAFVTRLHSLRDAEKLIRHGIPVVVSVAFGRGELDGAPLSSTPGHLIVVRGFTADGRVLVNDPAASANRYVRRTYRRDQFERAWLEGSGGIAYVMRRPGHALPRDTPRW